MSSDNKLDNQAKEDPVEAIDRNGTTNFYDELHARF